MGTRCATGSHRFPIRTNNHAPSHSHFTHHSLTGARAVPAARANPLYSYVYLVIAM